MSNSLTRIRLIAGNTVREAIRQRLVHFVLLLSVVLVWGARWLRNFDFGAPELKFLADCGFGAIAVFGSALTIVMSAQLVFSEIENRTVLTLLAKPVRRSDFLVGKFFGVAVLMAGFCAMLTGLLMLVLLTRERELWREMPEAFAAGSGVSYVAIAIAGAMQWLKFTVLAAYVLLVASFAQTQLFTIVTGFLVLVICQLQSLAHDVYVRTGTATARVLGGLLSGVFPNFQLFDLTELIGIGAAPAPSDIVRIMLYATGYVVVALGLATYSFQHREI